MRKLLKAILISSLIGFGLTGQVLATQLPKPVVDYVKKTFPGTSIRFDGLIELPDGTQYMPVLPVKYANTEKPTEIIQTLPAKTSFATKPNLVIFSNNLSLLKIIKLPNGKQTIVSGVSVPLKVKFGILPQDLIVPENFVVPEDLSIIMGDLKIRIADNNPKTLLPETKNLQSINENSTLSDLATKIFYITGLQSNQLYVFSCKKGKFINAVNTDSIPVATTFTDDKRYLLIAEGAVGTIDIIDTTNNLIIKKINVGNFPSAIVIPKGSNKAYISNRGSSTISVIDLVEMTLEKNISVIGAPSKIVVSDDLKKLYYSDDLAGCVYGLDLKDTTQNNVITNVLNISKIALYKNYLLTLSRTNNNLSIWDTEKNVAVKTMPIGEKPLDVKINVVSDKIYVLTAGNSTINVINPATFEIENSIKLKSGSFYSGITIFDSNEKAMITGPNSFEIPIVNLKNNTVIDYLPMSIPVNSLSIKDLIK